MKPAALSVLALCLLAAACSKKEVKPAAEQPLTVSVARVETRDLRGGLTASGLLVSREEAAVSSELSGYRVARVFVEEGAYVRAGQPLASFGVMGGSMQAQGHVQVCSRLADFGLNPQAASDAPRWRVLDDNQDVVVEWNFPADALAGLRARGHRVSVAPRFDLEFGSAQIVMRAPQGYVAASDHRKDGSPMGM